MKEVTEQDILDRVTYHAVNVEGVKRITDLRRQAEMFMNAVRLLVPEGREKSLAYTNIEQALMWANAGIARHPDMQDTD
jgi:hypothetical protein